jgi:hypothetical protein
VGAAGLAHDLGLLVGWWAALAAWLGLARLLPVAVHTDLWPQPLESTFDRPWRSLVWVLVGLAATLGLSRLHAHGFMLVVPGIAGAVAAAVEQLIIFAPVLLVPHWVEAHAPGAETRWLPRGRIWLRVLIGLALAELALLAYAAPHGLDAWWAATAETFDPWNWPYLVRVFCQDVAVAILFLRLRAVMGHEWAVALIAAGFAVAQLPAMGAIDGEALVRLVIDGGLGAVVLVIAARSADLWWFVWVHFAMDTMQVH